MSTRRIIYLNEKFYDLRALQSMSLAESHIASRMLGLVDSWGRLSVTVEALEEFADKIRATDEEVAAVFSKLTKGSRPVLLTYNDGHTAIFGRWDNWQAADFLRRRCLPHHPEPPLDVWVAGHCNRICRGNQSAKIIEGSPGWYPEAADKGGQGRTRADKGALVRQRTDMDGHGRTRTDMDVQSAQAIDRQPVDTTDARACTDTDGHVRTRTGMAIHGTFTKGELKGEGKVEVEQGTTPALRGRPPAREATPATGLADSRARGTGSAIGDWRAEARTTFGANGDLVIAAIEAVARKTGGFSPDFYTTWLGAKGKLHDASKLSHFPAALKDFNEKVVTGEVKAFGSAPWSWVYAVAGNGRIGGGQNVQGDGMKRGLGVVHATNREKYPKAELLPPGSNPELEAEIEKSRLEWERHEADVKNGGMF